MMDGKEQQALTKQKTLRTIKETMHTRIRIEEEEEEEKEEEEEGERK